MRFLNRSNYLLKHTIARAKLSEFNVPHNDEVWGKLAHPEDLIYSTIRIISEYSSLFIENEDDEKLPYLYRELSSVSKFYEYYIEAEDIKKDYFFYLTGLCSNFLSDNFGNSKALLDKISNNVAIECDVSRLLLNYFGYIFYGKSKLKLVNDDLEGSFLVRFIKELNTDYIDENMKKNLDNLVKLTLEKSTPEASFFSNILRAVHKKAIENSVIRIIPTKSNSSYDTWKPYFNKPSSIKVLWQAQKLIVDSGILTGKDATIQLPTGVGKTKSVELIILAAVLLRNATISIVVSPLRSLCNEISQDLKKSLIELVRVREISDVIQKDSEYLKSIDDFSIDITERQVIVLTPEKLYYLIRHTDYLIQNCGLIVFDEAHMFDDSSRGLTYELLVTKVKELLPKSSQKVFISAVMPNTKEINEWLTDGQGVVISEKNIKKTDKSVGFYSSNSNRLYFFESGNINDVLSYSTFIPNIVKNEFVLNSYVRGTNAGKPKYIFPDKNNRAHLALHLALNICEKGNVAIYFNSPKNIYTLANLISDLSNKGYPFHEYIDSINGIENQKIIDLISAHYGPCVIVNAAKVGIFPHYGDLENGLRLSIENAMKNGDIRIIACTSTLAEGVNLPIRYLLLTTFFDTKNDVIKNRKFQNLFGRTARSGKFTEGSLVCTDTHVFDNRNNYRSKNGYDWIKIKSLFDFENSESCTSVLNNLFEDIYITYNNIKFDGAKFTRYLIDAYSKNKDIFEEGNEIIQDVKEKIGEQNSFTILWENKIMDRVSNFDDIVHTLESYVLFEVDSETNKNLSPNNPDICTLEFLNNSLARVFADDSQYKILKILVDEVYKKVMTVSKDKVKYYKKSLLGIKKLNEIDQIVSNTIDYLITDFDEDVWVDLSCHLLSNECDFSYDDIKIVLNKWLSGDSYANILQNITDVKKDIRKLELFCRSLIGYNLNLIINAVTELLKQYDISEELLKTISIFQNRLRYGLPNNESVLAYELGFSDRIIAQEVGEYILKTNISGINIYSSRKMELTEELKIILSKYPSYFYKIIN